MVFPEHGVLRFHSETPAINTTASTTEANRVATLQNDPAYLYDAFFSPNSSAFHHDRIPGVGQVSIIVPTGPYGHVSFMTIATGENLTSNPNGQAETIYDYPETLQQKYWEAILLSLQTLHEQAIKTGDVAVAVENCISHITNGTRRTSRTIKKPHAQALLVRVNDIQKEKWSIDHLSREQRVFQRVNLMPLFKTNLQKVLDQFSCDSYTSLALTNQPPIGYTFLIHDPHDHAHVATVLRANHTAYTDTARAIVATLNQDNQDLLIPQPSYRLYMKFEAEYLRVSVSPESISYAGVMESAGIKLHRSQDYPNGRDHAEENRLKDQILNALTKRDKSK
jgi:hypothetical protein